MKLEDIVKSIHFKSVTGSLSEPDIRQVDYDSRSVKPGSLFCALPGVVADGFDFVPKALENGASAILSERPYPAESEVPWLQVGDARFAMAQAAAELHGHPSHEMPVIGVTGTNGKTTTAFLTHFLLQSNLRRAGMLGTVQYQIADEIYDAARTTPESPDIQRMLREMRDADCRGAVMEVASHGLVQHRTAEVRFAAGVFTNLSQDHLDYHGSMENYFNAKRMLFTQMNAQGSPGTMVVNRDDRFADRLIKEAGRAFPNLKLLTFGLSVSADFQASNIRSDFNGTQFTLKLKGRQLLVKVPLIGKFNVYNVLAALASAQAIDLNLREAVAHLEPAPKVPGRLESVSDRKNNYRVYVDYAHTPDALENALKTVRDLNPNRLITVFGCGGDRDAKKRPLMGEAADSASDLAILTSDNPRTEDPMKIIRDTERGMKSGRYKVIEDRRDAIEAAINLAGDRDIVLIAGKGHETYQEIGTERFDFDDRLMARQCIAAKAEFEPEEEDEY